MWSCPEDGYSNPVSPVSVQYLEKFHPGRTLARVLRCSQNWDWRIIFHLGWGSGEAYSFNQKTPEEEFRAIKRENIIGGGQTGKWHSWKSILLARVAL